MRLLIAVASLRKISEGVKGMKKALIQGLGGRDE